MKLQSLLPALITAVFLSTTLGSVIYSESAFANIFGAAFVECQKIKPNGKSFGKMKEKKNCFKELVVKVQDSSGFKECQKIKPNGKSFRKMKEKKNCFRDFALLISDIVVKAQESTRSIYSVEAEASAKAQAVITGGSPEVARASMCTDVSMEMAKYFTAFLKGFGQGAPPGGTLSVCSSE